MVHALTPHWSQPLALIESNPIARIPYYDDIRNSIFLGDSNSYTSESALLFVAIHEVAHATGSPRRLARPWTSRALATYLNLREECVAIFAADHAIINTHWGQGHEKELSQLLHLTIEQVSLNLPKHVSLDQEVPNIVKDAGKALAMLNLTILEEYR